MDRTVRKIETTLLKTQQDELRAVSAYDDAVNIVLLGDPGAGKTYTFRELASRTGCRYVTARSFLVTPSARFSGTLFIDGLDEKRAGRSDRDTVDALVKKLFEVEPGKVRISCRAADWLGESDLAALRPYFELSGEPVVLQLARLSEDERRVVLEAQGLSETQAKEFLREAADRALGDFLENPQNLIMLFRAVQSGRWPATRKELFEFSTGIMLKEFNSERARSGSGVFSPEELRPAAGAVCAARLISDVEAISLADHEISDAIPPYRALSMISSERIMAALGRRIFVAGPAPESVDYAHRTTAEYLAAEWLADTVRAGMPFGRLRALLGVDGHPAPELRGLHAWLAVHLPEVAQPLIDADPYGVLTYGDAASLPASLCVRLIQALGQLSQSDPWFRSGNWQSPVIGALSRTDMVGEFRTVLRSENAGFGVRSIVVEALALGSPQPLLKDDLVYVAQRTKSPYVERFFALIALLRLGTEGEQAAQAVFGKLSNDANALRLQAELVQRLYGKPFGPAQIVPLLKAIFNADDDRLSGLLYTLSEQMPLGDVPAVLDAMEPRLGETRSTRGNAWEVGRFLDRVLIRAWRGIDDIEPGRALRWLRLRQSYSGGHNGGRADDLRTALGERPDRLRAVTNHFLDTFVVDENRWLRLRRFREVTLFEVSPEDLLDRLLAHMVTAPVGSERELFFYEAAFSMIYGLENATVTALFERLYAMADNRADLAAVRDVAMSCQIPGGFLSRPARHEESEQSVEQLRQNFEKEATNIRNGSHIGWLAWAAQVYFGLFNDSDEAAAPRDRLVEVAGTANAETVIAGFIAVLSRTDLPVLADVVALSSQHKRRDWWFAITAGLDEWWRSTPTLDGLSDELIKAAIAFDLANPVFEKTDNASHEMVHGWKTAVLDQRPELVRAACEAMARAKLAKGDQFVDGLHELLTEQALTPFRADTALGLLRDFPNADRFRLDELLAAVLKTPTVHQRLLPLIEGVLSGKVAVSRQQHDMWLACAYLVAPSRYEAAVQAAAAQRPAIIFILRDHTHYTQHGDEKPSELQLPQLEFLTRLTGNHYPETGFPTGGWSGNTNQWDASEYCHKLVNAISAIPSEAATEALRRLESDPKMISYQMHLRHALANQEQRRREAEYDRPDWTKTIKALANGPPATVADLHALLLDQLDDLRKRIARENTDLYKSFWNVDSHARLKKPRPEEACRDTLVTLLRPVLVPKGVTVEPEGHMAADKRADISSAMPGRKILTELKRDYHADLWTAADEQLERFYAHDPEAKGFGIYGVFWFGPKRPSSIPKHPCGLPQPQTALELERMLRDCIPAERQTRLAVVVIDVSGSLPVKEKRRKAKKRKAKKSKLGVKPKKSLSQKSGRKTVSAKAVRSREAKATPKNGAKRPMGKQSAGSNVGGNRGASRASKRKR